MKRHTNPTNSTPLTKPAKKFTISPFSPAPSPKDTLFDEFSYSNEDLAPHDGTIPRRDSLMRIAVESDEMEESQLMSSSSALDNDKWSHEPNEGMHLNVEQNEDPVLSPISVMQPMSRRQLAEEDLAPRLHPRSASPNAALMLTSPMSPPSTSRSITNTTYDMSFTPVAGAFTMHRESVTSTASNLSPTHSIHPKRKPLYQHLQAEKNKFFISTLRKQSSKLFQMKQQIQRERGKWNDRLNLLSEWVKWNGSSVLHSRNSPQNALRELETIVQLWLMEVELKQLTNNDDRSTMLLQMDEKLNYLQSRGYTKKHILPSTLFMPSEASLQGATLALERKEYDYDLTLALKEIFGDLLETDRLVFEKIEESVLESNDVSVQTLGGGVDEPNVWEQSELEEWLMEVHEQRCDEHAEAPAPVERDEKENVFVTAESYHTDSTASENAEPSAIAPVGTNYISPTIELAPVADPEHPQSQFYEVAQLTHTIEQQEDEIASLRKENQLAAHSNQMLTQQVNQLKMDLQKQVVEFEKQQELYQKAKKQVETARYQKHELSQLEQELKFAEYKIQREKDRASDEIRSMKLEMEKMQQQMEENEKVTKFCKERVISLENNLHMDMMYTGLSTDKVLLNMEEIVDNLERGDTRTVVMSRVVPPKSAGTSRPRRLSSRSGMRSGLPSASTVASSMGEESVMVESTVALSDFTEVPQIANVMKASMKHLVDLSKLLEIARRERDEYKREFEKWAEECARQVQQQKDVAELGASAKKASAVPSGIDALAQILQEINRSSTPYAYPPAGGAEMSPRTAHPQQEVSPSQHSPGDERVLRSPAPPTVGLFADDLGDSLGTEVLRPRKRPSLRKNGTPVFPKRRSSLPMSPAANAMNSPSALPSINMDVSSPPRTLTGFAVPRIDTRSGAMTGAAGLRRKSTMVSVHVPAVNSPLRRQSVQ